MSRRVSVGAIVAGVVMQLLGLAADAVLHARDATLAEREGVLSLGNPGHLLFVAGLALCGLGACSLLVPRGRRPGRWGLARAVAPAAAVLALSGATFAVAARSGGLDGHAHVHVAEEAQARGDAVAPHAHGVAVAAPAPVHDHGTAPDQTVVTVEGSRHQHGTEVNVSWDLLQSTNQVLSTAKAATEKYRDVSVARAEGYVQVTQVVPGLGAHFIQPGYLAAGVFDPSHPAILLYDRDAAGAFELVGVSWTLPKKPGAETPPDSPFGPLAVWHYHTDLCFGLRGDSPTVAESTAAGCRATGGTFVKETPWMVHAWLFRASPEGVFSHENSTITGRPAASRR